jgi:hypothetical protein
MDERVENELRITFLPANNRREAPADAVLAVSNVHVTDWCANRDED